MAGLEVIYGNTINPTAAADLLRVLNNENPLGTLYFGYPILALADERVSVDALLVTKQFGLVAFLIEVLPGEAVEHPAWKAIEGRQDQLYGALESYLGRYPSLREGRRLAFDINTVSLLSAAPPAGAFESSDGAYTDINSLSDVLHGFHTISEITYRDLDAAINRVTTIHPVKKRGNVSHQDSRGATLKAIEREIANLDQWQKRSAIEVPDGVQRIRGLAGSGKTVVLALKAAYLHAQNPEWRIAMTFYTRSLYSQLEDLTRRFSFEHTLDEPDWEKLQVLHCWGSMRDRPGIYTLLAQELMEPVRDWAYAKAMYGRRNAFAGICRELLNAAKARGEVSPIFDAVLIDEAQDLPQEFFELMAFFTKPPHRIAFAYDELQQLNAGTMSPVEKLFGTDEQGMPRLRLTGTGAGSPRTDVVLPVCYRNPPWTLTAAHGIGFGVNRSLGLVQHFDNANLWREVGYQVISGNLEEDCEVSLARDQASYPPFFTKLISPEDAVQFMFFEADMDQLQWVAKSIQHNIEVDELNPDDILLVLPDAYTSKSRAIEIVRILAQHGIKSHHVGATSSQDRMFSEGVVAISHIHRAKGNEAAMVYVLDAQYAGRESRVESSEGLASRRNILFTAITRARAWVRVLGVGEDMKSLLREFEELKSNKFELRFKVPTEGERQHLRQLHRDLSSAETAARREGLRNVRAAIDALDSGAIEFGDLPSDMQNKLRSLLGSPEEI